MFHVFMNTTIVSGLLLAAANKLLYLIILLAAANKLLYLIILLAAANELLYVTIIIFQNKDALIPNSIPTLINELNVDSVLVCYVAQEKISLPEL